MAKLLIYQGDVLEREMELGDRQLRIGRSEDNDIVLMDPTKSVSRQHAEIGCQQGKYTLVDRESQNGIWLAGRRVPETTLESGVPVLLGTFKLILKEEQPAEAQGATILMAPDPAEAATIFMPRPAVLPPSPTASAPANPAPAVGVKPESATPAVPEAKAEAKPVAAPEAKPASAETKPEAKPAPVREVKAEPKPAPAPEVKPKPVPAPAPVAAAKPAPPPAPAPAPAPAAKARPARKGMSKGLVFGAAAALVLLIGGAMFFTPVMQRMRGNALPAIAATPSGIAAAPVATPAQNSAPAAASPAPAPRPAVEPVAQKKSTPPKPDAPVTPPAAAPAPKVARTRPAPKVDDKAAARTAKPPDKPALDLPATFEQARSATIKGDYLAAIAGFESILNVDPNYPNAANLLGVARGGAKNASQLAVDSGNKAEMSGDYATAGKEYDRALQLDPQSTAAPDAMRRLKTRMQLEGEATITQATQYDALGRKQDAIAKYERALQLLPPDHASVKTARERWPR